MRFVRIAVASPFLLAVPLLLCSLLNAQEFRATVAGRITDPAGGGIGDALIVVRNTETAQVNNTRSAEDGSYQVSFLTPGKYIITAEKAGFKQAIRQGITLQIAERGVVDFQMTVG